MVLSWLRRQIEIGGQEGRAEFDQLLHCVAFIATALADKITLKP